MTLKTDCARQFTVLFVEQKRCVPRRNANNATDAAMNSSPPKQYRALLLALFVSALLSAFALRTNGQGHLQFANTSATRLTNALTLQPAHVGMVVGLYISLDINAPDSALMLGTQTNLFAPGRFSQFVILSNVPEYSFIRAQVRAWSEQYGTYEQAVATGDPSVLAGVSNPFIISASGGTLPVENTAQFMAPFLVTPVPEPKPVLLLMFFLGMFLLFRRRCRMQSFHEPLVSPAVGNHPTPADRH